MTALRNPLEALAAIAEKEIGNAESPKGSNKGAAIQKYFGADAYKPNTADNGYAWCASFVSWCVQQWLAKFPGITRVPAPRFSAAFSFVDWGRNNGCLVFGPHAVRVGSYLPERGDIVVFGFSHCGIVVARESRDVFYSVEGNTDDAGGREGWEVARRRRTLASVELSRPEMGKFIRISPLAEEVRR